MAPGRTFTLNGTLAYPTEVEELSARQGSLLFADDGTAHLVERGAKRGWTLMWDSPTAAVADRMRALYNLKTFTITDHYGATYSVVVPADGLKRPTRHAPGLKTTAATTTPGLSLTMHEG